MDKGRFVRRPSIRPVVGPFFCCQILLSENQHLTSGFVENLEFWQTF